MKMIIAYIRTECSAEVMRHLHNAGIGGITCYQVHGIRSERPTFLNSTRPLKYIICRRY
jgi:nitrogen regulatory protein PII